MSAPSSIVVLAEDERHQRFIRTYLQRLIEPKDYHRVRYLALPSGRGSGEQWVRARYANEVKAYRSRSFKAHSALIVMIDADTNSVAHRSAQLEQLLAKDRRMDGEKIIHLVPKRHIETWVLCLNSQHVDEVMDYHGNRDVDDQVKPAGIKFYEWTRPNATVPDHCVLSLQAAIPEAQRLET